MEKGFYSEDFLNQIFSSDTEESRFAVISLTKLLVKDALKENNAFIFFKIINRNIAEASDILFSYKIPETFFSVLKPDRIIIVSSIEILVRFRAKELYEKNILCCLGVLANAYKNAKSGLNIYGLSVSDIQHISKYLMLNNEKISGMILDILNNIWLSNDSNHKETVLTAKEIIDGYFDNNKDISDVIPHNLLL